MAEQKALSVTRYVKVPLSSKEKNEKHEQLVRTLNDMERLQDNFDRIKQQHKANMKTRAVLVKELQHDLGEGFQMRACLEVPDLTTKKMQMKSIETGEVLEERALTVEELTTLSNVKA